MSFILTAENYYGQEANELYMSNSQYKEFRECEAAALAHVHGEYAPPITEALLVGNYVDAHFSGTLAQFRGQHPEIYRKDGKGLLAAYKQADEIIARIERDAKMMELLDGQNQIIKTGEIGGVLFKTRMDSYFPYELIVDLKVMRSFDPVWVSGAGGKLPFIEAWRYDTQGAIYQSVEHQNIEYSALPFVIVAATKEDVPDIAIIEVPQHLMDDELANVEHFAPKYAAIKRGEIEPTRCERCDYCKTTRVLTGPMQYEEFIARYGGGFGA
jgi:hypothetical protein